MMKTITTLYLLLWLCTTLQAQTQGEIYGNVKDANQKDGLPGVLVTIENSAGHIPYGGATDIDGKFRISGIEQGSYNVRFQMNGKTSILKTNVVINPDKITVVNVTMSDSSYMGKALVIEEQAIPLIDISGGTLHTLTAKEMKHLPSAHGGNIKNIVAGMLSDVKTGGRGEELYFRGSRAGSVLYFIDGVKVRENVPNIPSSGIASISVYTGGMPASYGDCTGGVIVINTKNYLQEFYQKQKATLE
jgi:hypothetical protein